MRLCLKRVIFALKLLTGMKRLFVVFTCVLMALGCLAQRVILVEKGSTQSLLDAISQANELNADKDAKPLYILIPDGFYDLGERVLTRITGHHIALIGQSMSGTVIQNKPDVKNEGLSKTAVIQNRHDKGTRTICNRVRLLSYQDTYYSDNDQCQLYFQDSEIHGTVDFICGDGDVWFERCLLVTEKRTLDGSGRNVITAPKTSKTQWGYIFNHCTVENIVSNFEYARGWSGTPHSIWLHTTLLTPEKLNPTRFDSHGMRTIQNDFKKEYGTMDAQGNDITPRSNVVTFTLKDEKNPVETILTADEAKRYTVKRVFLDWNPQKVIRQTEKKAKKLLKRHL